MTEVLKRQNSKSKKGYNQVSRKEVWEKTELRFKQPETNLAQTPTVTSLMWFLQRCIAVDKQQHFFFFTKSKHLGFYVTVSIPVYTTWLLFLHLCVFGVSRTFTFTVTVVTLWFTYTTHWLYFILFCYHLKRKYTVCCKCLKK